MGKKYIVEIGRLERLYKASTSAKGMPNMTWLSPEVDLTPYTEPDLEQVRIEAYEDGYNTGFGRKIDASYQEGLSDAWEAARKISSMNSFTRDEIFGLVITSNILDENTAAEAIEKLKAYEQKQDVEIKVGDEVINRDKKAVVTEITDRFVRIMYSDGSGYALFSENMTKTGRNFPEIAEVLEKMRGEQDG